jgi:antitoxin (DNA-binding transcriptional repressor) of toxin-antitoxin stability system
MNTTVDTPIPKMIQSISEAKAHFSAIVDEASGGKVFVICRAGRPLVTVSPYVRPSPVRRPGTLKGKIRIADDFDALPEGFAEAFG